MTYAFRKPDVDESIFLRVRDEIRKERMEDTYGWFQEGFTETDLLPLLQEAYLRDDAQLAFKLIKSRLEAYVNPTDDEVFDRMSL